MDDTFDLIKRLVREGRYLVKLHALQHALIEGFSEQNMTGAIQNGRILEHYPERNRVLVCGGIVLESDERFYLHVVCQLIGQERVEFVTAYIPDTSEWDWPPFQRKRRK